MRLFNGKKDVTLGLGVLMILFVAVYFYGHGKVPEGVKELKMKDPTIFESSNPAFPFSFEYPGKGWALSETRGRREAYDEIFLRGVPDPAEEFTPGISILSRTLEPGKTARELLGGFLKTNKNFQKFKILGKSKMVIDGQEVFLASYEHEASLPLGAMKTRVAVIRGRTMFVVKGDRAYQATLLAKSDQTEENLPIFEHMLKTWQFKG